MLCRHAGEQVDHTETLCVADCRFDAHGVTELRDKIKNVMTKIEMKRPTMRTERERIEADCLRE